MRVILGVILVAISLQVFANKVDLSLADDNWKLLSFGKIPSHQVRNQGDSLIIDVKSSASPLIHALPSLQSVSRVQVKGVIDKLITLPSGKRHGDEGADDFPFRLGLVLRGDKTLGRINRLIAPQWVKELYQLAPNDQGIDKVLFLNLSGPDKPLWNQRVYPKSRDLFEEIMVGQINEAGSFYFEWKPDQPLDVIALWLSIDGDDTKSNYQVIIDDIGLN